MKNTLTEYGLISKSLHWLSAILLIGQIPLGFYLVDLDFGPERLSIENIHVIIGLSIFYLVILRLIYKIFNPTPKLEPSIFKGQKFTYQNLGLRRPGNGISPKHLEELIGKKSSKKILKGRLLQEGDYND